MSKYESTLTNLISNFCKSLEDICAKAEEKLEVCSNADIAVS